MRQEQKIPLDNTRPGLGSDTGISDSRDEDDDPDANFSYTGVGEGRDAIRWFRLAINAFNYLTAPGPATHATRTPAPGSLEWMCQGSQATDTLTSLDAYSGLIAAYLASTGYRHPNRRSFVNELARSPRELENSDPFAPLILYGQSVARGDASPTIPENFLWAASNVQRIRRLNDVDVSRRLEVARAVLALQIVSQPDWVQILTSRHGFDTCRALKRILEDLERFGRQLWSADVEDLTAIDPALATVSIYLAAAADQPCAGDPVQVTDAARSGLLLAGAPLLADGISGFFERRRQRLEERAATGAGVRTVFDRVRAEMSDLAAGRPPPYTAVAFDYGQARVFVADWQRSVFRDAAMAMVREAGPAGSEIPGSREREFLVALDGAGRLANARPRDLYAWSLIGPAAGRMGRSFVARAAIRYWVRSVPFGGWISTVALAVLGFIVLVWLHVFAWRWSLVSGRAYARERRRLSGSSEELEAESPA